MTAPRNPPHKPRRQTPTGAAPLNDAPTHPAAVAESDRVTLTREAAQAIVDASVAAGFPPPSQVQAILEAAPEPTPEPTPASDATQTEA